jgi:hypothetical protein
VQINRKTLRKEARKEIDNDQHQPKRDIREVRNQRRIHNRPEAILVEVEREREWLGAYRELIRAKDALRETTGVGVQS